MSRLMRKPTICIGENKDADQLRGNRDFVFATRIVQFLFYLNPKFQASSSFLCLYRPVCVGAVRKPHGWFSHEVAQLCLLCTVHSGYLVVVVSQQYSPVRRLLFNHSLPYVHINISERRISSTF